MNNTEAKQDVCYEKLPRVMGVCHQTCHWYDSGRCTHRNGVCGTFTYFKQHGRPRYIPVQKTALDGKNWWIVVDTITHQRPTIICLRGKSKTKKACQDLIDYHHSKGDIKNL